MARQLTVRDICERALRKIGAYPLADTGASTAEMEEAREWLDMLIGHVASRKRTWWLVPTTARLTLIGGQDAYLLRESLPDAPQVQHITAVYAVDLQTGRRESLPLARRLEWEARGNTDGPGPLLMAHVDRSRDPIMRVHPAPPSPPTQAIDIVYQRFAANQATGRFTQQIDHVRDGWNLFLVTALAAEIGNGPVRKLPADEVREMQRTAASLLEDLEAYDDHEQADEPRLVAFHEF